MQVSPQLEIYAVPDEALQLILSQCGPHTVRSFGCTARRFRRLALQVLDCNVYLRSSEVQAVLHDIRRDSDTKTSVPHAETVVLLTRHWHRHGEHTLTPEVRLHAHSSNEYGGTESVSVQTSIRCQGSGASVDLLVSLAANHWFNESYCSEGGYGSEDGEGDSHGCTRELSVWTRADGNPLHVIQATVHARSRHYEESLQSTDGTLGVHEEEIGSIKRTLGVAADVTTADLACKWLRALSISAHSRKSRDAQELIHGMLDGIRATSKRGVLRGTGIPRAAPWWHGMVDSCHERDDDAIRAWARRSWASNWQ